MDPEHQPTIVQKMATASEGAAPTVGHSVKLRIWNDGQDQGKSVTGSYQIGANQLNSSVEALVMQMRVGDSWKIRHHNKITRKEDTVNLSLLSIEKGQTTPVASANTRAEEYKKQGNLAMKQKKYHEAISLYKKAYQLIEYACDKEAVDLKMQVMGNIALGTLNSYRFRECLEWCQKCLLDSIEPNKKILYREISAYKGLKQWESAKQKLGKALLLCKADPEAVTDFQALKQALDRQQKEDLAKEKKMYFNMFG